MMVLKITVKTLDSQNYQFEAEQDWTITQFKEHIQETVNVPASEQRLIFCGRVLQNDKKLTEYDCNDKVIHLVRRPPPSPGDESPNRRMATDMQDNLGVHSARDNMHLEGSFIITATTVETSTSASRPHATATVFVTSDSDTPGANIPVTIPLAINTQTGFPILPASFPIPNFFMRGSNQPADPQSQPNQQQSQQQPNQSQQYQRAQPTSQEQEQRSATGGSAPIDPTVTQPQYAMISGLVPVQFEYLLTYLPTTSDPTGRTNARIQFRPSRRSGFMQTSASSPPTANPSQAQPGSRANSEPQPQASANATFIDPSSMEIISTILNSIFRQPNQAGQQQPQQQQPNAREMPHVQMSGWFPTTAPNPTTGASPRPAPQMPPFARDPFMNMIPELAINAASQILGGIFGVPQGQDPATIQSAAPRAPVPPQAQPQAQPRRSSSGSSQYMDIEIDDGTSSHSGSRYHDATQNEPVGATPRQHLDRATPSTRRSRYNEIFGSHPTWIPIIEADVASMDRDSASHQPNHFSDAYLSSIPKKRRKALAARPDNVPILQPSTSQAITGVLDRAMSSVLWQTQSDQELRETIANDREIQEAYEEYIRSVVGSRLEFDEDYCPDRHEHTKKYFK